MESAANVDKVRFILVDLLQVGPTLTELNSDVQFKNVRNTKNVQSVELYQLLSGIILRSSLIGIIGAWVPLGCSNNADVPGILGQDTASGSVACRKCTCPT